MLHRGNLSLEGEAKNASERLPGDVDYSGNNWVTWLTVRMLQYTLVHRECEGVLYTDEDRKTDEEHLHKIAEEARFKVGGSRKAGFTS